MEKDWNQLQSKVIDALRFPMAVAVVLLHHAYTLMNESASATISALCVLFHDILCRLPVPFFFLVAGYLFFSNLEQWDWGVWKTKIRRRVWSLLVPYILWNIIAFFAYWGYARLFGEPATFASQFEKYGGLRMFFGINGGIPLGHRDFPINGPMWFVRDLMYYILITPAVFLFISRTRYYGLFALLLAHLLVQGIVPEGFAFFVAGSFFKLEGKNIVRTLWPSRNVMYIVSLVLVVVLFFLSGHSSYWVRFFKFFFLIAGIGASFCLAVSLIQEGRIHSRPFLVRSSFFVYALHVVLLPRKYSHDILSCIYPFSGGPVWDVVEFFLTPALLVAVCLAILWLLEKCMPSVAALLNGNRSK